MGILDDAIKEHLDLKRQHGADESELKQLEDEAFGEAERPGDEAPPADALSEAPTEFMTQPDAPAEAEAPAEPEAAAEAPGPEAAGETPNATDAGRPEPRAEIADLQEPPEPAAAAPPLAPKGPSTEEREAIAEQPTEMFDVEEELAASQSPAPSEEELVEEGMEEPRLAPIDPLAGLDEGGEVEVVQPAGEDDEDEVDDDFWNEQRLSDELDQALEAPLDDDDVFKDEPEADQDQPEQETEAKPFVRHDDDEDVLEETPNFLEEDSEDDQLWFEQKPPKDFDFDD